MLRGRRGAGDVIRGVKNSFMAIPFLRILNLLEKRMKGKKKKILGAIRRLRSVQCPSEPGKEVLQGKGAVSKVCSEAPS